MLPPAWKLVLEKLAGRRSPASLMPLALLSVVKLADVGRVKAGRVDLSEFEKAYAEFAASSATKPGQGWQPFYHLSGRTGLWSLWKGNTAADFSDMPKKRPSSGAALRSRVDHARLRNDLARELERPETRVALQRELAGMRTQLPS